ncbi:MAG: hypothetical protein L0215_08325 [Gemmataceae bacterium]|nr:hypothetical protein [Gemmataceae bacterium]
MKATALEPLFLPWEEPNAHRVRAKRPGEPAEIVKGRRPSGITIAHNLRDAVREWRKTFYAGASDTTRQLLGHWFERSHRPRARNSSSATTSANERPSRR